MPSSRASRFLRSPRTIVAEVAAIALLGGASTLGLPGLFLGPLLLLAALLAAASLSIVLREQWGRLRREWPEPSPERILAAAPFRTEFERSERLQGPASTALRRTGRAGLAGSFLFHCSLLALLVAGSARLLLAQEASVELYEGETLPPDPSAFTGQWPGVAGAPFSLTVPLTVTRIEPRRFASGALEALEADVELGEGGGGEHRAVAVNAPLELAGRQLHVSSTFGVAAFLEVRSGDGRRMPVSMLEADGPLTFGKVGLLPDGTEIGLRVEVAPGERPRALEARVVRGGALLGVRRLAPGEAADVPGLGTLVLHELRWWARFTGSKDVSALPAFGAFLLGIAGAILLFVVVPVDELVAVERVRPGVERVTVALRPHRFVPLHAERFEALLRREGGLATATEEAR